VNSRTAIDMGGVFVGEKSNLHREFLRTRWEWPRSGRHAEACLSEAGSETFPKDTLFLFHRNGAVDFSISGFYFANRLFP
jgi:hypothetical protein